MNERQFGKSILETVQSDWTLKHFYEQNVRSQPFEKTVEILANSLLSKEQIVKLALFIGLSTEMNF